MDNFSPLILSRDAGDSSPAYRASHHELAPRAVGAVVCLFVFLAVTLIFTGLRFVSRHISGRPVNTPDWVFLAAEFIFIIYTVISLVSLFYAGVGYHVTELSEAENQLILKLDLVLQTPYALCMALVKTSICLLYLRIFPQTWIRVCSWAIIALSASWALMTILVGLLICHPLTALWNPADGSCGNENASYASVSAIELSIDSLIILLPQPVVWRLRQNTATKLVLSCLFCLGLLCIGVTGVRLHELLNLDFDDFSYSSISLYYWTDVELAVGIMVACGMGLRPLFEKILTSLRLRTGSSAPPLTQDAPRRTVSHPKDPLNTTDTLDSIYTEMRDFTNNDSNATAEVSVGNSFDPDDHDAKVQHAITITREVLVERQHCE